ncbi:3-hydroxyacyl-CoA dehydrogenase family protein [Mycobacterium saskatchewanense]|uniref:3-hydroxyacyl-CoA dehydrogenase family protein n=1 Tax=Mycobacterium saskatchewanense TaxID=220927 RepID=UPI001E59E0B9|nr:3-hydroxyacyl-CoA dehydrogenase family protein [Mycobacterium saskatchewanense]
MADAASLHPRQPIVADIRQRDRSVNYPVPRNFSSRPVAVIGAGTLGRRIALMFATRGGAVHIYDMSAPQRAAAVEYVAENIAAAVARVEGGSAGISTACHDLNDAVAEAWLVVEAVPEKLELKKQVFAQLDAATAEDTILASNSSSFPSRLFTSKVGHPERVLNIHFYMPPDQSAVDIMSCGQTERSVMDFVKETLPLFGIYPFEAHKESIGFIFNRVWAAIKRECLELVAEGVSTPHDVDRMFQINTGMPGGPFRMMDQVGLDVVLDIEKHYEAEHPEYPRGPRQLLEGYIADGRLGVKTGAGFYDDYPTP